MTDRDDRASATNVLRPEANNGTAPGPPSAPPTPPPPPRGERERAGLFRRITGGVRAGGWPLGVVIVVGLLVAFGIGSGSSDARADDAEADAVDAVRRAELAVDARERAQDDVAAAGETITELEDEVARLEGRVERMRGEIEQADVDARAKVEAELAEQQAALDARSAELDQRSSGLDARDAAISQTEQRIEQNSFGNGVWEVGVDIQPGKYKTAGTTDCYWSKLTASGDIIDNDIVDGPSTVIIEGSVFTFTSSDCGTWTLVP